MDGAFVFVLRMGFTVVLIEIDSKQLGTHQYLDRLKSADNVAFADTYNTYLSRYKISSDV